MIIAISFLRSISILYHGCILWASMLGLFSLHQFFNGFRGSKYICKGANLSWVHVVHMQSHINSLDDVETMANTTKKLFS
jgi:hypothetical protein